jgi:hypothetical protein
MFNDADHFDDLLFYRRLPELVQRTGLVARNWPEPLPTGSLRFNVADVNAAAALITGQAPVGNNNGTQVMAFADGSVLFGSGDISTSSIDGVGGVGVGAAAGDARLTFLENEGLGFVFPANGRRFGVTLSDFGTFSASGTTMTEKVLLVFFNGSDIVSFAQKSACRVDGGLATFDVDTGVTYDAVVILPQASTGTTSAGVSVTDDTKFFLSEVRICPASSSTCRTSWWTDGNACP